MTDGAIRTPLHELHEELGARMGVFAGHALPLSYPGGQIAEHLQCQSAAALFDVSHMGQILIPAPPEQLETLMPQDLVGLAPGRQRYGFLTNDQGGIRDDLMVANRGDHLFAVVNAANAAADLAHLRAHLPA